MHFGFKIFRSSMAFCLFWAIIERRIGNGRTLFLEMVELWFGDRTGLGKCMG